MHNVWKMGSIVFACSLLLLGCSSKDGKSTGPSEDSVPTVRPSYIGNSPVRLNEIVPVNISLEDHQGEDPAWLELYNPADTSVNMAGFALTDDLQKPRQWVFGNLIVPPKGYQIVYLSGKNIVEVKPAMDSVNLMGTDVYDWNDSDRDPSEGEPGHSTSGPFEYPNLLGQDSLGKLVLSAKLSLGDNMSLDDEGLRWSSAHVGMTLPLSPMDLSTTTVVILRGYIQNGRELTVRFVQSGMDSWLCWAKVLRGNGKRNGEYRIILPQGTLFPNLQDMRQILFEATGPYLSSIEFTIQDLYALDVPVLQHTNFKVGKKASTIWLLDSTAIRDSLAYPEMSANLAWGFDQEGKQGYLQVPTPWAPATQSALPERMPVSKAVQTPGFYPTPIEVMLQVPTGSLVHYTLDGSEPTLASPVYSAPLPILKTTVIRSLVEKAGSLPSPISSQTFFIADSSTLPVVSISTDPNGLFSADSGIFMEGNNPGVEMPHYGANFWAPKELPVSVEFFDERGTLAWNQDAGLSIFGNYSRNNDKKAVTLKFREQYGKKKLEYPVFPLHPEMEEFRTLALRANGGNSASDYIRDALAQNLAEGLDVDYQINRPVLVYYNGQYFGLFQMLQKMDSKYPETAFGIAEENVEFVEPVKGTITKSYEDLKALVEAMDSTRSDADAQAFENLVNLQGYMNYMALQFYVANTDWPANNLRLWRGINPSTKWRFMLFDVDFGFGSNNANNPVSFDMFKYMVTPKVSSSGDTAVWPNGTESTLFYRKLFLQNRVLRPQFANRIVLLLAHQFSAARVGAMIDSMMTAIQAEVPRDQARWDFDAPYMASQLEIIRKWATARPANIREQLRKHYGFGADVQVALGYTGPGSILMDGFSMPLASMSGPWLTGQQYILRAVPAKGASFAGWSDGVTTETRTWSPESGKPLTATFR